MRWFLLLPFSQLFLILAVIVTPILPFFATKENKLPNWLKYFDTPDENLDGDHGFRTEHAIFKGDNLTKFQRYVNRCHWLWRNPAYGWDWIVLAYKPEPEDVLTIKGTRGLGGHLTEDGWYFARKGYAWQLYITHHWNETHCTKLNFGWKLWTSSVKGHQFVFSPTGFWKKI